MFLSRPNRKARRDAEALRREATFQEDLGNLERRLDSQHLLQDDSDENDDGYDSDSSEDSDADDSACGGPLDHLWGYLKPMQNDLLVNIELPIWFQEWTVGRERGEIVLPGPRICE
jgi:hypothetical protein